MSQQTVKLMGKPYRHKSKWPEKIIEVTNRLVIQYGTPSLGNYRDPVKEIIYILLSARTTEVLYKKAHRQLFKNYPTLKEISEASPADIMKCIDVSGLGSKRSVQIIELSKKLLNDLGPNPKYRLRQFSPQDAYNYLTMLPGVGPKSALCVMMYSLDMDVFPVDVNVQRIAERMGILTRGLKHYEAQSQLPKYIPSGLCKELHIGLVIHGREVCLPQRPNCTECVLLDLCRTGKKLNLKIEKS